MVVFVTTGAVGGVLEDTPQEPVTVTAFAWSVTAVVRERSEPVTDALVCTAIEASAITWPLITEVDAKVALLPTTHQTPHACALPVRDTWAPVEVVIVVPIWNMNNAVAFPSPSSVAVPVMSALVSKQYFPGLNVFPANSVTMV